MGGLRAAAVLILAAALLGGCRFDVGGLNDDAKLGPCLGASCECFDTTTCAPTCGEAGDIDQCQIECARMDACESFCADDCENDCNHVETCSTTCGDGCVSHCDSAGSCQVSCGHDCAVDCTDVGRCEVEMLDGEAWCNRAGTCSVVCVDPAGERRPAVEDAGGAWRCAPSP